MYLKNGSIVKGVIIEQIPGVSIKVETADGSVFVFKVQDVEKLTKERKTGAVAEKKDEPAAVTDESAKGRLMALISQKAFLDSAGQMQMNSLSKNLSQDERFFMYNTNKKDNGGIAIILNLLLPSIGSWIQGDFVGALVEDLIYITGFVMMGVGWEDVVFGAGYTWEYTIRLPTPVLYVGAGFVAAAWITSLVIPFIYESNWNNKLAGALNVYVAFFEPDLEYRPPVASAVIPAARRADPISSARINLLTIHY